MKLNDLHPHTHLAPQKISHYLNNVALVTTHNESCISKIFQEANTNSLHQPPALPHPVKLNSRTLCATTVVWAWIGYWRQPLQNKQYILQEQQKPLTTGEICGYLC